MRRSRLGFIACDAIAAASALLLALACASEVVPSAPPIDPAPPGAVRVRLVFGEDADLDLYVTGPAQESVYFGNRTSRDGGELLADQRCDATSPRVETIAFARATPGRYRVGVDFMIRCARNVDSARFELIAELPGEPPIHQHGEAHFGAFAPRTLEFELR